MSILKNSSTKKPNKQTLNKLYKNINQAILIASEDKIIYLNKKFKKSLGYSFKEISEFNIEKLIDNDDFIELKKNVNLSKKRQEKTFKQSISLLKQNKRKANFNLKIFSSFIDDVELTFFTLKKIKEKRKSSSYFKKIENKNIQYQNRLRRILDLVPHVIFLKDEEGNILLTNKACENFYNKTSKQLVYRNISDFHENKEEVNRIKKEDRFVIRNKKSIELDNLISTDYLGEKHFFKTTKIPFTDPVTKKTSSLGISIDITQQKSDEQKLNEAKEKYRLLVERGSDGIIILKNEKIVFANNQAAKLFDKPIENFLNEKITTFIKKEVIQKIIKQYALNAKNKNLGDSYEIKIKKPDGQKSYVEAKINTISYATEKSSLIFLRDITKRKKAEQLRERDKNMLEQAQTISKLGSWEWNVESKKIYCSNEIYNIVELDKENKPSKSNWFMKFIPDTEKSRIFKGFLKAYKTGGRCEMEFPIITAKNNRKIIQAQSQVFKNKNGKHRSVIGTWLDITERIRFEQILKTAKARAEESDKLKSAFLANMSHEIRTPMNAIIGFANLLKMFDLKEKTRREYIDHVVQSGETLLKLIDDIVDISKMEANQLKIEKSNINLNKLLEQIQTRYEELILLKHNDEINITLEKTILDNNFIINTDSHRLQQIISNLINNAIKFTKKGEIKFGYKTEKTDLIFFVEDNGLGINKKNQEIIFKRFGKLEDPEKFNKSGTGLGLSISKHLVELLGGSIWLESELGKGATFYFSIPLKKANDTKLINETIKIDYKNKNLDLSGKHILIAEDELLNYKLLENLIKKTGAEVLWAKNGLKAIEIFSNRNDIDLIFMDIKMPEIDGYEATRRIKKINPNIPIIAQTAFAFANEKQAILKSGCNMYISKPINYNEIYKVLDDFLLRKITL